MRSGTFFWMYLVFLMLIGSGCAVQPISAPIPMLRETSPVVMKESCEDAAWNFDPSRDIPDFSNACAWRPTAAARIPWSHMFHVQGAKQNISIEVGCMRHYAHRYANVMGIAFYVFCRPNMGPDILEWYVKGDESPIGWTSVSTGKHSWVQLGWSPHIRISGNITVKPMQVHWLYLLFQSRQKGLIVSRLFTSGK